MCPCPLFIESVAPRRRGLGFRVVPAEAAPVAPATAAAIARQSRRSAVTQVQWVGRGAGTTVAIVAAGARPRGIGLGAGVIIGSIIANEAYRPRRGYYYDDYAYDGPYYYPSNYAGDPRTVCAQNFRSFEWSTGLYTTY